MATERGELMTVRELNAEIRKIRECISLIDEEINRAEVQNRSSVTIREDVAEQASLKLEEYIRLMESREVK